MTPAKGSNDVYKTVSMCLASALLTLAGAYFATTKNAVTKDEVPALVQQNNPYTQDAKDIKAKLDDLRDRVIHLDDHQRQMGEDVAAIAAKAGVTAHPIAGAGGRQ